MNSTMITRQVKSALSEKLGIDAFMVGPTSADPALQVRAIEARLYDPDLPGSHVWPLMKLGRLDLARRKAQEAIKVDDEFEKSLGYNGLCTLESEAGQREASGAHVVRGPHEVVPHGLELVHGGRVGRLCRGSARHHLGVVRQHPGVPVIVRADGRQAGRLRLGDGSDV
mgnify:CR=1 FL=1